jgi:D-3-phosphoglycerate dehydrogenase
MDIAEQIISVLNGQQPKSPVNIPLISTEVLAILKPYIDTALILGRLAVQLVEGQVQKLTIRYEGEISEEYTRVLRDTVLTGFLKDLSEDHVNMINADVIAHNRGIIVNEEKEAACVNYNAMIIVDTITTSGRVSIGGTSLHDKTHLAMLNDFWLEIEPAGSYLLFTEHKDRPGVIGEVGSIMGRHDINISQMKVSRGVSRGSNAMMVLCLDEPLPEECREQILAIPDMYQVKLVNLTD